MQAQYLTEREVSQITKFALPTLRNHRQQGIGIPYVKANRAVRYSLQDVLRYMESRKIKTADFGTVVERAQQRSPVKYPG
jgi:hypothetical protein